MKRLLRFAMLTLTLSSTISVAAQQQDEGERSASAPTVAAATEKVLTADPGPAIALWPRSTPTRSRMGVRPQSEVELVKQPGPSRVGPPTESAMQRAASVKFDLRMLPQTPPKRFERPERERPETTPVPIPTGVLPPFPDFPSLPALNVPAPSPAANFAGLDFFNWGAGHPPDPNGDAGPTYYIQTINTSIGVYRKSDGVRVAAFTFDTLMSQGHFGNLCDTDNFGDPVVVYDSFEDRWIITDFAFQLSGNDVVNPPGSFQCFAASMTGDPVNGGWNFYSINTAGGLGDYPKFGIWPDGLYMTTNMFDYAASGSFQNSRVYALNKAQMYAGKPSIQVVSFDASPDEFTILPANARLQVGAPPAGSPNYCAVVGQFTNATSVYKFHVDWNSISTSSFTGPFLSIAPTSWITSVGTVPSLGGNSLDTLNDRLMVQNQYTNLGGVESLWMSHTVRGSVAARAAPRYYQVDVTGGTVGANTTQAFTHTPDSTMNRFMPSVAVDRAGDMAIGYSTSNSTSVPAVKYAGRLAADPINTLPQTEVSLINGTGTQSGSCGGTCARWGDYSAMTLDPDGCTFWYTNMYYATTGLNFLTQIGSFAFPSCTTVGAGGTLQGTLTAAVGGAPISGVSIAFGARSATTNGSGFYSFASIPAGTYSSVTVIKPGYVSQTATPIVMTDGGTTTKDFALDAAPASGCLTDTAQTDFQTGVPASVDLTTNPGDVVLLNPTNVDQQNTLVTNNGFGFDTTNWSGQTFTASVTGQLSGVDVDLFCSGCTGTTPNITVAIQATSGSPAVPTGADLATGTIPGFSSNAGGFFNAVFTVPLNVTAGTRYAIVMRPVSNPSAGTYAYVCSCGPPSPSDTNPYVNGQRVTSSNSGVAWAADVTAGGVDLGFRTYIKSAFVLTGSLVSGLKDSNPVPGLPPVWSTLSWTATTPANTSIKFQVAGSNSDSGPFNFVGPDGTNATFFTTGGASLSQFFGLRYLEYKAVLATTSNAVTPTLSDVTICFTTVDCSGASATITPSATLVCHDSTGNTASGPAGATSYSWSITNGIITGGATTQTLTYTAGASGSVGLTLTTVDAAGCHKTDSTNVSINSVPPTPTITPGGPTSFCTSGSVTLNSSSATGNQWFKDTMIIGGAIGASYMATAAGDYTVTVTAGGCTATSASVHVTISSIPATPTITPGGPTTFCSGGSVTLNSSSATGNQWFKDTVLIGGATASSYIATAAGDYTVAVTTSGCTSATSVATHITINALPPVPTISGPSNACSGSSATLTSSSATGNQWFKDTVLIPSATGTTYAATTSGSYTVQVTNANACTATSAPKVVTIGTAITVNPASISNGTVGVAYSVTFGSTGGTGAVTFSVSGSVLPGLNLASGTLSGTPTAAGTLTITITATDTNGCTGTRNYTFTIAGSAGTAPANVTATALSSSQVMVSWTPVATATSYDVIRTAPGGMPAVIASPASNFYSDSVGLISGTTYVYRVHSNGPGFPPGNMSAPDIATTIVFTDDPLVAGSTLVKGVHLTELRAAVNAVRNAAGLIAATFTDTVSAGLTVKAVHIQELRSALDPARSTIGVPAITYGNAVNAGTLIHATDLTEIRNGVK